MKNKQNVCEHVDGCIEMVALDESTRHPAMKGLVGLFIESGQWSTISISISRVNKVCHLFSSNLVEHEARFVPECP